MFLRRRGPQVPSFYGKKLIKDQSIAEVLTERVNEYFTDSSFFLTDLKISEGKVSRILVVVDGDQGISIDDCASLSRSLGKFLDESNLMGESPFHLEVSSPGIDSPLTHRRQYSKNEGREVKVTTEDGSLYKGKLLLVQEEELTLALKEKNEEIRVNIPLNIIRSIIVQISFK